MAHLPGAPIWARQALPEHFDRVGGGHAAAPATQQQQEQAAGMRKQPPRTSTGTHQSSLDSKLIKRVQASGHSGDDGDKSACTSTPTNGMYAWQADVMRGTANSMQLACQGSSRSAFLAQAQGARPSAAYGQRRELMQMERYGSGAADGQRSAAGMLQLQAQQQAYAFAAPACSRSAPAAGMNLDRHASNDNAHHAASWQVCQGTAAVPNGGLALQNTGPASVDGGMALEASSNGSISFHMSPSCHQDMTLSSHTAPGPSNITNSSDGTCRDAPVPSTRGLLMAQPPQMLMKPPLPRATDQRAVLPVAMAPPPTYYVYRPVCYPDHNSPAALHQANQIMSKLTIPGNLQYIPVKFNSRLFRDASGLGFTAMSIVLGSTYFQRLVASMPHLEYAIRVSACEAFTVYLDCLPPCSEQRWAQMQQTYGQQYSVASSQVTEESTLASILYACVYIACKMVDRMPRGEMLRLILSELYDSAVSRHQSYDVEAKCLEGLGFRLGPYFRRDELNDDWEF